MFMTDSFTFNVTFMHLADAFIQRDLQAIHYLITMCVPWELNPEPFALLTQCSTRNRINVFHISHLFVFDVVVSPPVQR